MCREIRDNLSQKEKEISTRVALQFSFCVRSAKCVVNHVTIERKFSAISSTCRKSVA